MVYEDTRLTARQKVGLPQSPAAESRASRGVLEAQHDE